MFSKDDIIFSYTTKQAVADGVLIKAEPEQSSQVKIKVPVYFTRPV
jgi:type I site-specific restriction endonuclease